MQLIEFFIERFRDSLKSEEISPRYFLPRTYRNSAVNFRNCSIFDFEQRHRIALEQAHLNVFKFPANKIPGCDLFSDSGTTTMTMEQLSRLLLGDEAYGSNEGYFELKDQVVSTFGDDWADSEVLIFHQGRACEHALFKTLGERLKSKSQLQGQSPYYIIPSNGHFDTTEANIRDNNIEPRNLFCPEYFANLPDAHFKGNIDIERLHSLLESEHDRIPLVYLTITNNTGGGQPVSMENIKKISQIAHQYNTPFFFDASRFAENAWFIQKFEAGQNRSIPDIVREMFSYIDGFHMSAKKDGLVNIGGLLVIKRKSLFIDKFPRILDNLTDHQILTEGHPTYGGLAGRDLKALVQGFKTVLRQDYLDHRIKQVWLFGDALTRNQVPILRPVGGHAVYIDMDKFFEGIPGADADFKGVAFTALLLIAGHRLCELGIYAFGAYKNGKEIPPHPRVNYVRAAVPRLVYEERDLYSTAEAITVLYNHRDKIPGVEVTYGQDLTLRHFKSDFKFKF
jgi:tryptophanase